MNTNVFPSSDDLSGIDCAIEIINHRVALDYLLLNAPNNRRQNRNTVRKYAKNMREGNWDPKILDPIRFNEAGQLVDGQHRLLAIVEANVTLPMLVVRGLNADAIHAIDTGRNRSPSDMLKVAGYRNTNLLAAGLRSMLMLKTGPLNDRLRWDATHADIRAAAERHPLMQESCQMVRPIQGIRPSLLVAIHYVAANLLNRPEQADAFMQVFNTGIPAYPGDPAQAYREVLLRGRRTPVSTSHVHLFMSMAYVWNKFNKGKKLSQFRLPDSVDIDGLDRSLI